MNIFQAIISGIVQGITVFFPISSSGHLVILQALLGLKEPQLAFDIFLHLGTLISILIFFRKDILRLFGEDKRLFLLLLIASIPTFIIGFLFKDAVEKFFAMPKVVGCMLGLTGVWLVLASLYVKRRPVKKDPGIINSILIGIAQGVAIMPGISRSGATISTGILTGLDRELSFKFSFLLAIPAILGASVLKAHEIGVKFLTKDVGFFLVGGITAMIIGLAALNFLFRLIKNNKLHLFGIYCIITGLIVIILV